MNGLKRIFHFLSSHGAGDIQRFCRPRRPPAVLHVRGVAECHEAPQLHGQAFGPPATEAAAALSPLQAQGRREPKLRQRLWLLTPPQTLNYRIAQSLYKACTQCIVNSGQLLTGSLLKRVSPAATFAIVCLWLSCCPPLSTQGHLTAEAVGSVHSVQIGEKSFLFGIV